MAASYALTGNPFLQTFPSTCDLGVELDSIQPGANSTTEHSHSRDSSPVELHGRQYTYSSELSRDSSSVHNAAANFSTEESRKSSELELSFSGNCESPVSSDANQAQEHPSATDSANEHKERSPFLVKVRYYLSKLGNKNSVEPEADYVDVTNSLVTASKVSTRTELLAELEIAVQTSDTQRLKDLGQCPLFKQTIPSATDLVKIAIRHQKFDVVKCLVEAGVDIQRDGLALIIDACMNNHTETVKLLTSKILKSSSDSEKQKFVKEVLDYSKSKNIPEILQVFLDANPEILKSLKQECVDALILDELNPTEKYDSEGKPIAKPTESAPYQYAHILLKHVDDPSRPTNPFKPQSNNSILRAAAKELTPDAYEVLLGYCNKSHLNHHDEMGFTPMHHAVRRHPGIVKVLLEHGASPYASEAKNQWSPVHFAAVLNPETLNVFIEKGVNLSLPDQDKRTPLFQACRVCNPETIRVLLKHSSDEDVLAIDEKGKNIFHVVLESEQPKTQEAVAALLEHPKTYQLLSKADFRNVRPHCLALNHKNKATLSRITSHLEALPQIRKQNAEVLKQAIFNDNIEFVEKHIDKWECSPDSNDLLPIHYAIAKGHFEAARAYGKKHWPPKLIAYFDGLISTESEPYSYSTDRVLHIARGMTEHEGLDGAFKVLQASKVMPK